MTISLPTVLSKIRKLNLRDAQHYYESKLNLSFTMTSMQHDDWGFVEKHNKAVVVRSRGGSKTNDFVNWIIFHVLRTHEQWCWLACKGGQLQQAMIYVSQNPFVKSIKRETSAKFDAILWSGKSIRFGIISTSNLGLRVDGIVYDEFEDLKPMQESEIYPQMAGMMTHSIVHKTIYLGTLWIGALLNEYSEMYPLSVRSWETLPWLVKSGMIQDEIDAKITPQWQLDLMYNCIPTAPHGLLFPQLTVSSITDKTLQSTVFGMDFGSTDHCVGISIINSNLYVLDEWELQLEGNNQAFDFLKGMSVEAEGGGYNDSDKYAAKCQLMQRRIKATRQAVTNKWKSQRVMEARKYSIFVDKNRTPGIYKDLKNAVYGSDGLYLKDSTHPNHWLDAFLHAIHPFQPKLKEFKRQRVEMHQPSIGGFGSV